MIELFKKISLFLMIFSVFNDAMVTEYAGEMVLKLITQLFIVVHLRDFYYIIIGQKTAVMKSFYTMMLIVLAVLLFSNLLYLDVSLDFNLKRMIAIFAIFVYIAHYKDFDQMLYVIWITMIISAIYAFFGDTVEQYTFRKSGGNEDPNEYAAQLLSVMFITVYLFKKNKNYYFLFGSLAFFFYSLLYAGSKSSFIFLSVLLIIILFVKKEVIFSYIFSLRGMLGSIALFIVLGGLFFALSGDSAVSGLQERAGSTGTFHQRLVVWSAGLEMIADNFFLGVGFGEFPLHVGDYLRSYLADEAHASHNVFIKIFAESGVFSFIAFCLFIFSLFHTKYSEIIRSNYFWVYLSSLAVILMGLTIPTLHHKDFWVSLGVLANAVYQFEFDDVYNENNNMEVIDEDRTYIAQI